MNYLAPTPIDQEIEVTATIEEVGQRKMRLKSRVYSGGTQTAEGEVIAIRVPDSWRDAN